MIFIKILHKYKKNKKIKKLNSSTSRALFKYMFRINCNQI